MRLRLLAAMAAAGLFIAPALADRKKTANTPETTPPPVPVLQAPRPCDAHCPAGLTLPSPKYLHDAAQKSPEDPNARMQRLLNESEDLRRAREEMHRLWMNNQPSVLTYERLHGANGPGHDEQLTVKTYAVGDLVVPVPMAGSGPPTEKPKTLERELIQKITTNVEPKSWSAAGGPGIIEYYPLGMGLVINQTPAIQAAVERYLDALRRMSDLQVSTELVVLTLSDAWFEKAGLATAFAGCEGGCKDGAVRALRVKPEAVRKFLRAAKEDGGIGVLTAPTLTSLCGQPAQVKVAETERFVTGVTVNTVNGDVLFTPKQESHDLGLDLTLTPEVSADGIVTLAVSGGLKELGVRPVRMIPISTQIRPVSTDGKTGETVPFTQMIQDPKILTRKVSGTVAIQDGGCAILYGGKTTIQETVKEPVPFAADVPILAALFSRDKTEASTNHLLVVVTTHVVKPEPACADSTARAKPESNLAKLLGEYGRACKDGKVEEARRLAIECLAIDPMCFGKK